MPKNNYLIDNATEEVKAIYDEVLKWTGYNKETSAILTLAVVINKRER
jgi:hypothetical protein